MAEITHIMKTACTCHINQPFKMQRLINPITQVNFKQVRNLGQEERLPPTLFSHYAKQDA